MIEALLEEHSGVLLSTLIESGGFETGKANNFLPAALSGIGKVIGSGDLDLDLASLLEGGGGGVSELLGKLDIAGIASSAGLEEGRAQSGLACLVPGVISLLGDQAGGVEGLLGMLDGPGEGRLCLGRGLIDISVLTGGTENAA
jgi:hypothetical protein